MNKKFSELTVSTYQNKLFSLKKDILIPRHKKPQKFLNYSKILELLGDTYLKVLDIKKCGKKFFSVNMTRRKIIINISGMSDDSHRYF